MRRTITGRPLVLSLRISSFGLADAQQKLPSCKRRKFLKGEVFEKVWMQQVGIAVRGSGQSDCHGPITNLAATAEWLMPC
jgi:hypothetical protein